jgi:hypothetical protein
VIGRRRLRQVGPALACAVLVASGCGKKGPPLPPLVLLPDAPSELSAVRRGPQVDLTFHVPGANTDRSTPADLARIDVYAAVTPEPLGAEQVVREGTRVATLPINKPPDPDEPPAETRAPDSTPATAPDATAQRPAALDQNAVAHVSDPLPGDADPSAYRTYVAVGFNARGRRGALSTAAAVPLAPPPPAPAQPRIEYDEKAITLSWPEVSGAEDQTVAYSVYTAGPDGAPLTPEPIGEPQFADEQITWDQERCYEVRSAVTINEVRIESEPSTSACVTPHDTFAPAAPEGLVGVGAEGAVSLIWTANSEPDLAGYLVLRAVEPETVLAPLTPEPIADTNFRDTLPSGSRATYAVVAVDKAGNRSEPSSRITESSR